MNIAIVNQDVDSVPKVILALNRLALIIMFLQVGVRANSWAIHEHW